MNFKITYKLFSIPSNDEDTEPHLFEFTYQAEISQLGDLSSYVNEYLQQFFTVGNYELLSMTKAEELEVE